MFKDRFKSEIAEISSRAFKSLRPELYKSNPDLYIFDPNLIYARLEVPKSPEMGNYALPLFELAKELKENPVKICRELAEIQNKIASDKHDYFLFEAAGGFNNVRIKTVILAEHTLNAIHIQKSEYGSLARDGAERNNIVIDFSSPNIAKPFGIGHLRSTSLGHALYRILEKLGYNCIGINHLGDWGTQFGKMIVAFRHWGDETELKKDPITYLYDLYVRFHKEEENDSALTDKARAGFKALEEGAEEETEMWNKFKDYSLNAFKKTYDRLGIVFDYYTGESFYNDKMEATIERLNKAGLTEISEGALIVNLQKYDLPDCLLRKADGSTLYATRDITAILYRLATFDFDQALYVVGSAQRDHFRQVFKVIELLEVAEDIPAENRCSHRLKHIEFGWIKFGDAMMSTRRGNIIFLDDVLDKATNLAREKIMEKNPDLKEIEKTSAQIGIGAVLFADMSTRRHKDVNFDWEEVLNFDGESGPYLQYTHARLSSLVRRYGREITASVDYSLLDNREEYRVLDLLYKFPETIDEAGKAYEPFIIVSYLFELATAFNRIYQRKDENGAIDRIIDPENPELSEARMSLVEAVRIVIKEGLYLLGIDAPEEM